MAGSGPSVTANLAALNFLVVNAVDSVVDGATVDFDDNCVPFDVCVACAVGTSSQNHGIFVVSENKCVVVLLFTFEFPLLLLVILDSVLDVSKAQLQAFDDGDGVDVFTPETTEKPSAEESRREVETDKTATKKTKLRGMVCNFLQQYS